jgi:chorismate synthase
MSSMTGKNIRISVFGQSHAPAIGVVIAGLPAGFKIDAAALGAFLARRAPGGQRYGTQRREADAPEFLSGLAGGGTCGAPLAAVIRNTDTRSGDYDKQRDVPRPAHADYTAQLKFHGAQDISGGGHFSGRLTAPLCVAGGICLQLLERESIFIAAHIASIGAITDAPFDPVNVNRDIFEALKSIHFPVLDQNRGVLCSPPSTRRDRRRLTGRRDRVRRHRRPRRTRRPHVRRHGKPHRVPCVRHPGRQGRRVRQRVFRLGAARL